MCKTKKIITQIPNVTFFGSMFWKKRVIWGNKNLGKQHLRQ